MVIVHVNGRRVKAVEMPRSFEQKHASMLWNAYVLSIRPTEFKVVQRG